MQDFEEKEQRFKFLLSKIDGELDKFRLIKLNLDKKKSEIVSNVPKDAQEGLNIILYSSGKDNANETLNSHIIELENLKRFISEELQKVLRQKEIANALNSKYPDKISISEAGYGVFNLKYTDSEIKEATDQVAVSKKLIDSIRESLNEKSN